MDWGEKMCWLFEFFLDNIDTFLCNKKEEVLSNLFETSLKTSFHNLTQTIGNLHTCKGTGNQVIIAIQINIFVWESLHEDNATFCQVKSKFISIASAFKPGSRNVLEQMVLDLSALLGF